MINLFGGMYLRPGQLWKTFRIKRKVVSNQNGYPVESYEDTDETVRGILAEADTDIAHRTRHLWDQDQHSLTHTLVVKGQHNLLKGDVISYDDHVFLVLVCDDIGELGRSGLIYLEKRVDIK